MKKIRPIVIPAALCSLALIWTLSCEKVYETEDVTKYADPNIGTVSHLLTTKTPTVHRPHSMARVFPVTKPGLRDRYFSDKIYGFAVNLPAYRRGHVTEFMVTSGGLSTDHRENASVYDHDLEILHPWYHQVWLEDYDIIADWTTTERSVIYRFKPGKKEPLHFLFRSHENNRGDQGTIEMASFEIANGKVIRGWEYFFDTRQYFYAEFSRQASEFGIMENGTFIEGKKSTKGKKPGAYVKFEDLDEPLEVRIGISFINEDQAKDNLYREASGKTFEEIKEESHQIWKNALEKIIVEGGTERQKRIFYTALYRSYERMIDINEYGRYYSGFDKKVHEAGVQPFYVDDWLWDTFRNLHPLQLILEPDRKIDMVRSYITAYEQSGWLPNFPQFFGDYPAMLGFNSSNLIWDTYQKGLRDFDVQKAYQGMKKNALEGTMVPWRIGPAGPLDEFYHEHGWFPALPEDSVETVEMVDDFEKRQAVAVTLEHSYNDWCLSQLAKELEKIEDYQFFKERSRNYRKLFNPETGFMSPKMADGNWVEPFCPQLSGGLGTRDYFAENNSWVWSFYVLHDIPGLIELMGGNETFIDRLDALFNTPPRTQKFRFLGQMPDATGLTGLYPAGNQPSNHIPYLYNYAGYPWKTQRRIRQIMDMWFDDRPLGIPGDEDGGSLSSWYVFSALGFYPVTPGSGLYAIGSPFFENARIKLPNEKFFTVEAVNNSKRNKYIQSATLNGEELNRSWITHEEITTGGELRFIMGDRPNKAWAAIPYDRLF